MPHYPPYYCVFVGLCGPLMNSNGLMSIDCLYYLIGPMVEAARPLRMREWSPVGGGEWNDVSALAHSQPCASNGPNREAVWQQFNPGARELRTWPATRRPPGELLFFGRRPDGRDSSTGESCAGCRAGWHHGASRNPSRAS